VAGFEFVPNVPHSPTQLHFHFRFPFLKPAHPNLQPTWPAPPSSPSSGLMLCRHRTSGWPCPEPRHLHFPFCNGATPLFPLPLGVDSRLEAAAPLNSTSSNRLLSSAASASRPPYIKLPRAPHLSTTSNPAPSSRSPCSRNCPVKKLQAPPQSTVAQPSRATPVPTNAMVRIPLFPSSSWCSHGEKLSPESPTSHLRRVHRRAVAVGPPWTGRNFGPRVHAPGPPLISF
jgi:hypothetical protein